LSSQLHSKLAELYEDLARVHSELAREDGDELFDQKTSPLGRKLHCRLIRSGQLPGYQAGRRLLAKKSDVLAYLEQHRVKPTDPAVGTQDEDEDLLAAIGGKAH